MSAKQSPQILRSERTWRALGEIAEHPVVAAWRDKARKTGRARPIWRTSVAVAATLVLAVGAYAILRYRASDGADQRVATTALGERRNLILSDGTRVALNTATRLDVDYRGSIRRVRLVRGEALFTVARDSRRPFVVMAADRQVVALGTAFGVRLDGSAVKVTLVEGRIEVKSAQGDGRDAVELKPGQQWIAKKAEPALVRDTDVARATSWQDGWIVFNRDNVRDAIDEVSRYTRERIVCDDPRIATLRVSGTFRTGEVDDFIDALTKLHPLSVERQRPGEIQLKWRE